MSIILEDYQFEFGGVVFGIGAPISIAGDGFEMGTNEFESQDAPNPFTDAIAFGRDSVVPGLWTWDAHTDLARYPEAGLLDMRALAAVWNRRELRRTPSAVAPLRYCIGGETRVIYGRPRPFTPTLNNGLIQGLIPIQLEFQPVDTLTYSDEIKQFLVMVEPASDLGVTLPATMPISSLTGTPTTASLPPFDGDADAPFEVTFAGPCMNPRLAGDGWEVGVDLELVSGESITVSTYPWEAIARRADGTRLPGVLSIGTRLSRARLSPAGESLKYSAIDSSGTSSCAVVWRPARTTF